MENPAPNKRRRRTQGEIREIVSRYSKSRLTQEEFSRLEGISRSLLCRHLRQARLGTVSVSVPPPGLLELEPIAGRGDFRLREPYRVCLGREVSVEIPAGFCGAEIAKLLSTVAAMKMS